MAETPSSSAEGRGLIPGWGAKIPHAVWCHTHTHTHTHPNSGTSLLVQWLRLKASNAGGPGSIHGQGIRSHMLQLRPGAAK